MAINHKYFTRTSQYGSALAACLTNNEQADIQLAQQRDVMLNMINNADPSLIANFDEVVKRYGVLDWIPNNAVTDPQRQEAKDIWLEIDSVYAKRTGSVSGVQAARDQLYSKLRG